MCSLQILQAESHPHIHNQGPTSSSGAKEGLSVYGLFHHFARTPQGKQLLRQYFLRPSTDIAVINEKLDTATVFLRPDNHGPLVNITKSLGQIKNMRAVMTNLKKGVSSGLSKGGGIKNGIWSTLRSVRWSNEAVREPISLRWQFAFHAMQIRDTITEVMGADNLVIKAKVSKPGVHTWFMV